MVKTFRGASTLQNKVARLFTQIDIFGERVEFDIKGAGTVKSVFGAILSLIIFVFITAYAANKFNIMKDRDGTDYQTITANNALDPT